MTSKFFWGIDERTPNMQQHAQPQVPDAGDRRLARALRPRLRRRHLLPPRRSEHADRGDGVGDERHRRRRARRCTGARASGRPTRSVPRGRSPSAITCTSRSSSSRSTTCSSARTVEQEYARLYDDIGLRHHDLEPARVGSAHRQVQRRHPRRSRVARSTGYGWLAKRLTDRRGARARSSGCARSPTELGCSMAQLALAWCASEPERVDRDHRCQSRPSQVVENFEAIDVLPLLTAGESLAWIDVRRCA